MIAYRYLAKMYGGMKKQNEGDEQCLSAMSNGVPKEEILGNLHDHYLLLCLNNI